MSEFERPDLGRIPLDRVLHALADADRLAIIRRLACGDEVCCRVAAGPDLPKATLSRHFKTLRAAGLVETRKEGLEHVNRLRRDEIDARFPGLLESVLRAAGDDAAA